MKRSKELSLALVCEKLRNQLNADEILERRIEELQKTLENNKNRFYENLETLKKFGYNPNDPKSQSAFRKELLVYLERDYPELLPFIREEAPTAAEALRSVPPAPKSFPGI